MKYITVSDIHLGNPNTPTSHIANNFKKHVLCHQNVGIDVLFINGDLFDQLLYLSKVEAQVSIDLCVAVLDYCYQFQIKLRILEGTPIHDWFQSSILTKLNDARENKVDLKYFKTLDIEYFPDYNKHVLYIPDEFIKSQEQLEKLVNQKLQEHRVTQVDMAMLHGQFSYQVKGMKVHAFSFDEVYFLNLAKHFIHIGHFHVFSQFDRILANGSFDRIAHNEEDPKGYILVNHPDDQPPQWYFITNPDAFVYKTIRITPKMTVTKLDSVVFSTPKGSHIRLLMPSTHEFNTSYQELKVRYGDYHLKKKLTDKDSEQSSATYILSDDLLVSQEHLILESNIYEALIAVVNAKHTFTPRENEKFLKYIDIFKTQNTSSLQTL